MGLGLEMGSAGGVMMVIGYFADKHWNTSPWLLLSGAFLGMLGAGTLLIRVAKRLQ